MEETPRPRPVQRDGEPVIPVAPDDGEVRPRRRTASDGLTRADAVADADRDGRADGVVAERDRDADERDRETRVEEIRTGPATVERVQVQRPGLTARERRGAAVAGAVSLPLITLGLVTLAVPIGAWYATTMFTAVAVAVVNLFRGEAAARDLEESIPSIQLAELGTVSTWLLIGGAVLTVVGLLLSWIVLRRHGVHHAGHVTLTSAPMALGLSALLQAAVGALGGLLFGIGSGSVTSVVANSVFALLLFLVAGVVIAIVVGILVWLWMARVFRATVVTGTGETRELERR